MLYCVVKSCFSLLKYKNNMIDWGVQLGQLNINILCCTDYFLTCLRQQLDKYTHGSKKTHVFVSVFADWAAARAYSDSVPGLAGSRRSWWLHWFPGFCGPGTIQAGGTGSAHGGALQVQMLFLCLTWTQWTGVVNVTFQKLYKYYCSAGIGRTGVLITMETALCLMECGQPVYPLEIVRTMRDQRAMMIQTPVCRWKVFFFLWNHLKAAVKHVLKPCFSARASTASYVRPSWRSTRRAWSNRSRPPSTSIERRWRRRRSMAKVKKCQSRMKVSQWRRTHWRV